MTENRKKATFLPPHWSLDNDRFKTPLASDLNQWALADKDGLTVAHVVANQDGRFPPDFDGWNWKTDEGLSVIDCAREANSYGVVAQFEAWQKRQTSVSLGGGVLGGKWNTDPEPAGQRLKR